MPNYTIERVSDTTYLDDAGQVVQGVAVRFRLHDFDEVRTVNAANDHPATIENAIEKVVDRRQALAELGG